MKKILLTIVIVLLVLIAIAIVFICAQRDKLTSFALEKAILAKKQDIVVNMPNSVPPDSAGAAIDQLVHNFKNNNLSKQEIQNFAHLLQTIFSDQKLDSLEAKRLYEQIKDLNQ